MYKLFVSALLFTILVKAEARAAAQMPQGGGPPGGAPPGGFGGLGGQAGGGFQVSGPGGMGFGASTGTSAGGSAGTSAGSALRAGGIAGLVNNDKKSSCGRGSTAAPATTAASA